MFNKLIKWNIYEILWFMGFSFTAVILSFVWGENLLGFIVFLSGVLCVVLTAKGMITSYMFGMINTLGYAYISYSNHLFGEMGLNLFFFMPTNIIGFILWKKNIEKDKKLTMRKMSIKNLILIIAVCLAGIYLHGLILSFIPIQNTPYIDATTNVLSVIATILTVYRYREQWLLYILLNIFTIIMWSIRTLSGSADGVLMIVMWTAYLINAIYGFYNWSKGAREAELCINMD